LPLTSNGKVDRARLPSPFGRPARPEAARPQALTPAQSYVLGVCRAVLDQANVGVDDNFFQVGGHSLLAMQVLARLEKDTGTRLSPRLLLMHSLGQVAESLPAERVPARP
jgi:hypothetical protein